MADIMDLVIGSMAKQQQDENKAAQKRREKLKKQEYVDNDFFEKVIDENEELQKVIDEIENLSKEISETEKELEGENDYKKRRILENQIKSKRIQINDRYLDIRFEVADIRLQEIMEDFDNYLFSNISSQGKRERALEVFNFMSDNSILDTFCYCESGGNAGRLIASIDPKVGTKQRIARLFEQIMNSEGAELHTLDAYFMNRMAKIIEQIMHYCCGKRIDDFDKLYHQFISSGKELQIMPEELFKMTDEQSEKFRDWFRKQNIRGITSSRFLTYLKLRTYQNKFYEEKDVDLLTLCEEYPECVKDHTRDDDCYTLLYITLKDYGLPIGLHMQPYLMEGLTKPIEKASRAEMLRRVQSFPLKLSKKEQKRFRDILNEYYRSSRIPELPEIEEEDRNDVEDRNVTNSEHEQTEETPEVTQNQGESITEQEIPKKHGKRVVYKEDSETLQNVINTLKSGGIIQNIPEEFIQKLSKLPDKSNERVSHKKEKSSEDSKKKSSFTKLERFLLDMKQSLVSLGVPEDRVDIEAAKMFFYMKVFDRSFWQRNPKVRDKIYEMAYKEIQEHGDELFAKINSGESLESVKKWIGEVAPRKRAIKGAKTIEEPEVVKSPQEFEAVESLAEGLEEETIEKPEQESATQTITERFEQEVSAIREKYEKLKEAERQLLERKTTLEKELNNLITECKDIIKRKREKQALLQVFSKEENVKLLKEINLEEKLQELTSIIDELEHQLISKKEDGTKKQKEIKGTDAEIEKVQKEKAEVEKQLDDMFK